MRRWCPAIHVVKQCGARTTWMPAHSRGMTHAVAGSRMPPSSPSKKSPSGSAPSSSRTDIDLALAEGEALGIIGPNGAGKTTLFGIITGTVPPDAGRVLFAGADITRLAPERRCRLGIAPLVPDPAAVRRHDRVREPGGGGGVRRRPAASARSIRAASSCSSNAASPTRPTGRRARSRCSTASGSSWRARSRPSRACCCSTRSPAASPSTNAWRWSR